jgi:hypothetical protein
MFFAGGIMFLAEEIMFFAMGVINQVSEENKVAYQ